MKLEDLLTKTSKYPVMIAFLFGVLVVSFMPPLVPKHKFHLDNNFSAPNRMYAYYADSIGNITDMSFIRKSKTAIALESDDNRLYDIKGLTSEEYANIYMPISPPERNWVFIEDLTDDTTKEILYVSQENDSTMLYVSNNKSFVNEHVIALPVVGDLLYRFFRFYYFGDSSVVYFSIATKIDKNTFETVLYSYDYASNILEQVYKSSALLVGLQFRGYIDKILFINKVRNVTTFTGVDLLTHKIQSFEPPHTELKMFYTKKHIQTHPYHFDDDMFFFHNGDSLFFADIDAIFNENRLRRILVKKINIRDEMFSLKYVRGDVVYFTTKENSKMELHRYSPQTGKLKHMRIKGNPTIGTIIYSGDLDRDGHRDIVYTDITNADEAFCIYQEGSYGDVCRYPIAREKLKISNCAVQGDSVLFQSRGIEYVMIYKKNPKYYQHWLWCGLIFLIVMMIGVLVKKSIEVRAYRKNEMNTKILYLQLENVQKRIDPHFIFNSLNNLGSLILNGESNVSYDYLSKVSSVLYKALRNRSILVTIESELNFCSSVLDTQRQRFKEKFDYEVFIDKGVNMNMLIPSNILNSMADNSIKHGFADITNLGLITIEFIKKEHGVLVIVEDNGKGRKAALLDRDKTKSTGTGLEICYQYVKLFNQKRKGNRLDFKMIDLYTSDELPAGTRCEFYVPDDLQCME